MPSQFFSIKEFATISKKPRKWAIRTVNQEGARISFDSHNKDDDNKLLKGKWTFLNYGRASEETMFENGGFDVAIPEATSASSWNEPKLISGDVVRFLYCKKDRGSGYVETKIGDRSRKLYCRDISTNWYFGVIWGKFYGAIFAVKPDSILNKKVVGRTLEINDGHDLKRKGLLNNKLAEILKLAAGEEKEFMGKAKTQNSKNYVNCKDLTEGDQRGKNCFLWGAKFSSNKNENQDKPNCDDSHKDIGGCNIGIIDVSRYTLEKTS